MRCAPEHDPGRSPTTYAGCACTAAIARIPHSHRYHVTDTGLRTALFLTRAHNRLLRTGLAEIHGPPVVPTKLRAAATAYEHAINALTRAAQLAA